MRAFADDKDMYTKYVKQIKENSSLLLNNLSLNKNKIIGIEYIVASGTDDALMSKFGHSLLRFVDNDYNNSNDIVLGFEADLPSPEISYMKGIGGGYESTIRFDSMQNYWQRYVRNENRPLLRYIIPSNAEMRSLLIDRLQKLNKNPELLGDYTFFSNNCAGLLANFFKDIGMARDLGKGLSGRIPTKLNDWLELSLLVPFRPIRSLTPESVFQKIKKILSIKEDDNMRDYDLWNDKAVKKIRFNLTKKEILFLYNELWDLPESIADKLLRDIKYDNDLDYAASIGINKFDNLFYELCTDKSCGRDILNLERQTWGESLALSQVKMRERRYIKVNFRKKRMSGSVLKKYVPINRIMNEFQKKIKKNFQFITF